MNGARASGKARFSVYNSKCVNSHTRMSFTVKPTCWKPITALESLAVASNYVPSLNRESAYPISEETSIVKAKKMERNGRGRWVPCGLIPLQWCLGIQQGRPRRPTIITQVTQPKKAERVKRCAAVPVASPCHHRILKLFQTRICPWLRLSPRWTMLLICCLVYKVFRLQLNHKIQIESQWLSISSILSIV